MIYEENLKVLENRYRDVYNAVVKNNASEEDEIEVCIEDAKNGEKIVKCSKEAKEYYLNSRYNPTKEAEKFMETEITMPDESVLTMIGLANGSFARAFLSNNSKNINCVIYEPSISIFMQVLKNIDITDILSDERVTLIVKGINETRFNFCLTWMIQSYNKRTNHHIVLPKYGELFRDSCLEIERILNEQYDRLRAETNAVTEHGIRCCENSIQNMRYLPGCRSGRDYIGVFPEELPVIIVSAGPSLDKNVALLKEAKGRALIIVVDTAIPRVMAKGIKPDLIISVDYNKSLKHFKVDGLSDITFLANMDMNTKVLDYVKPKNVIFDSTDSLVWDRLFTEAGSAIQQVDEGGSVSTAAIAHMIAWGFKKIILVGQDLALTDNKVHAGERENSAEDNKWATTYVKGINGEDILTRKDYCIYIRWIESVGYRFQDIEFIDATEGGAFKEHTTIMTLREAIDRYCTKEYDIDALLEKVPKLFAGEQRGLVLQALQNMKSNLKNMRKLMINGTADCRKAGLMMSRSDYNVKELKRINASIGKLDEALLNSEERVYLAKYVSDADIAFSDDLYLEEDDDIKEAIRMYQKSEIYYQSMAEAIPKIIDIIEDCYNRMTEES